MDAGELEKQRKKYAAIALVLDVLGILLIIAGICFVIAGETESLFVFFAIAGMLVALVPFGVFSSKYEKAYKKLFANSALLEAFEDVTYDPDRGIPEAEIKATHIYRPWDRYHSSDYVSGKYKGVAFEQADVRTQKETETTDSDGHTHTSTTTIFSGRWMIFDYNKSFRALVKVLERSFGDGMVYDLSESNGFEKVSMENEVFNKKFHTLSTSMEDAFYLLTPQLMETLLELEEKEKGKVVFLFKDSRLHVGLNNGKESFSPGLFGLFKKVDEEKVRQSVAKDIQVIMDFADSLRLDNNLFKSN